MINLINKIIVPAFAQGTQVPIEQYATEGEFFGYTCVGKLVSSLISTAFIVSGIAFFMFLVWGGMDWIMSGGDKGKIELAQKRITNAIVGLAIVATSYAVFKLVIYFFGLDLVAACPKTR